jgi:hypothetical protein
MRRSVVVVLVIALVGIGLVLAGCQSAEEDAAEAEVDVAQALADLQVAADGVATLTEDSTVDEATEAKQAVEKAWADFSDAIVELEVSDRELLRDAYDQYVAAIESIPEDATAEEARVAEARAAARLENTVNDIIKRM